MKKTLLTFTLILTFALAAGGAQAISLSSLLQNGSIVAGDKVFDQWGASVSSTNVSLDYSLIDITALSDGGDDPGPGLMIDLGNQMSVSGIGRRDLTLTFRVSTIGDKKIKDNSLTFGDPPSVLSWSVDGSNDLGLSVSEWVRNVSGELLADKFIEFSVLNDVQTRDWPDSAAFLPQDEIYVETNFLAWSSDETDSVGMGGIEQRFSQIAVPEPATLALFGLGLLGLLGARRRAA